MRTVIFLLLGICFIIKPVIYAYEENAAVEKLKIQENKLNKTGHEKQLFNFEKFDAMKFIKPDVCGQCHSEIYSQWEGATHSKAFIDPIWRAATKLFYNEAKTMGQVLEVKLCVKCHIPLGFGFDVIQFNNENYEELMALPAQGTFCNWCHNINEALHIGGSGADPGTDLKEIDTAIILGPRKDPRWENPPKDVKLTMHPSEYSELYTKSDFCGLCHNMSYLENKLPIVQTFDEWKKSPYNTNDPKTTITCQDCHMRQRSGIPGTGATKKLNNPGKAADNGPTREHVWTHYFAGGNSLIPKLMGSDLHSFLAIERLTNAAELEIITDDYYEKGKISQIKIKAINSGAGHYLPTGMTVIRQMWLEVKITSADGITIFASGTMDKKGDLEKNTVIYNTVLSDKNGEPTMNIALADRILYDHRIPPKDNVVENYNFIIPEDAVSPLNVEVILKYRTASPDFVRKLLGEKAPHFSDNMKSILSDNKSDIAIPVIDMTSSTEKIKF